MSYYFVNNKYPISDPNIDLNFNNDILYQKILGDESIVDPRPYDNGDQQPRRSRRPNRSDIRDKPPTYNILLSFILITILIVITFYLIHSKTETPKSQIGGYEYDRDIHYARHLIMPATTIL